MLSSLFIQCVQGFIRRWIPGSIPQTSCRRACCPRGPSPARSSSPSWSAACRSCSRPWQERPCSATEVSRLHLRSRLSRSPSASPPSGPSWTPALLSTRIAISVTTELRSGRRPSIYSAAAFGFRGQRLWRHLEEDEQIMERQEEIVKMVDDGYILDTSGISETGIVIELVNGINHCNTEPGECQKYFLSKFSRVIAFLSLKDLLTLFIQNPADIWQGDLMIQTVLKCRWWFLLLMRWRCKVQCWWQWMWNGCGAAWCEESQLRHNHSSSASMLELLAWNNPKWCLVSFWSTNMFIWSWFGYWLISDNT